jgi:hypothetical protein
MQFTGLERLAGPSAPHAVTPQQVSDSTPRTSQRAEQRRCMRQTDDSRYRSAPGSAFAIGIGFKSTIGITGDELMLF